MRKLEKPLIFLSALAAPPSSALAGGIHNAPVGAHPYALLILALITLLYGKGLYAVSARGAFARIVSSKRLGYFALALFLSYLATASPVAELGERLFSTHMAQHLVLMLIAAPLFVAARTSRLALHALAPVFKTPALSALFRAGRVIASPVVIWLIFTGLFLLWHLPALYAWALRSETAHALEHASFFVGAFGFWSVVFAPARARAAGYGGRLLFVTSAALLSGLPGALIALATRPLYQIDLDQAARLGLTPLEDQQLAGLVMWIPGGLAYLVAILALLSGWMRESERRTRGRSALALCILFPCALSLTACDDIAPKSFGVAAEESDATGGNPKKGADAIAAIGCGACHTIPGVNGAIGLVGPPLDHIGRRVYIAGLLRNTPQNLEAWLQDPQKIAPGNVMPNMGISPEQSRDIAAYLYTLR